MTASEVRVRYAETDQMGVAYHANYLVWCEVGRTDLIRHLDITYAEMERQGVRLAVADAQVRYQASARYDDVVRVETRLTSLRSRLLTFRYDLFRVPEPGAFEGERLATASTTLISVSSEGRPVAMPRHLRDILGQALLGSD